MIPRPITRSPGTRTTRTDTRQRQLESLAAEFALLAQRRARVMHQVELLDQQREAAASGFAKLQARLGWLMERMDALDPELRAAIEMPAAEPEPEPEPPPYQRVSRYTAAKTVVPQAPAPVGQRMMAVRGGLQPRTPIGKWRI